MPDPYTTLLRRLLLWTFVCGVSAAPSFVMAGGLNGRSPSGGNFDRGAMAFGVALFILLYTAATSTEAFERFHARAFVRRTLYIGYAVRVGLSVAFPIGVGVDLLPGMLSVSMVEKLGLDPRSFGGTFATTLVQGAILNVLVFLFMFVVYGVQRMTMKPPATVAPPGFDVVLPAQPVAAPPAADAH
jgi:hypothetical protein